LVSSLLHVCDSLLRDWLADSASSAIRIRRSGASESRLSVHEVVEPDAALDEGAPVA
jgi:hypothetical protein